MRTKLLLPLAALSLITTAAEAQTRPVIRAGADSATTVRDTAMVRTLVKDSTSLDGEWSGTIETPGPAMPFSLVFKSRGDTLTGTIKRSSGNVPLIGSVKADTLTFSYTIDYNGNPFTVSLHGIRRGSDLSGQADYGEGNLLSFQLKKAVAKK